MKICPTCGSTFHRRVEYCFADGTPLRLEEAALAGAPDGDGAAAGVPPARVDGSLIDGAVPELEEPDPPAVAPPDLDAEEPAEIGPSEVPGEPEELAGPDSFTVEAPLVEAPMAPGEDVGLPTEGPPPVRGPVLPATADAPQPQPLPDTSAWPLPPVTDLTDAPEPGLAPEDLPPPSPIEGQDGPLIAPIEDEESTLAGLPPGPPSPPPLEEPAAAPSEELADEEDEQPTEVMVPEELEAARPRSRLASPPHSGSPAPGPASAEDGAPPPVAPIEEDPAPVPRIPPRDKPRPPAEPERSGGSIWIWAGVALLLLAGLAFSAVVLLPALTATVVAPRSQPQEPETLVQAPDEAAEEAALANEEPDQPEAVDPEGELALEGEGTDPTSDEAILAQAPPPAELPEEEPVAATTTAPRSSSSSARTTSTSAHTTTTPPDSPQAEPATAGEGVWGAPEVATSSRVTVQATPVGAKINIDGQDVGASPLTRELPLGLHTFRASSPGFKTMSKAIQIAGSQAVVPLELEREVVTGRVEIKGEGNLQYATVYINGSRDAQKLPASVSLAEGSYTFRIVGADGAELSRAVEVRFSDSASPSTTVTLRP